MKVMVLALITLAACSPALMAQQVPEGIHSPASGPVNLCGHVEPDLVAFETWVRANPSLQEDEGTDRFEVFNAVRAPLRQYILARPSEPAYPAITCRLFSNRPDGGSNMTRQMRCDASREACDALFIEFQELDARVLAELRGQ